MTAVDVYYGAASGQQRAALRRLEPEGVMISHATQNNTPFDGDYELFVDSGGYHHMMNGSGEYESHDTDYVDYLDEHDPELFALRDYPCEPELVAELGRSVEEQQWRTTNHHRTMMDRVEDNGLADGAVAVVQGWTVDQYMTHLDELRDYGLVLDRMAIGTVCRRGQDEEIADIILAVREELPPGTHLHAFGVKGSVLKYREVCDALDSADSAAYDYTQSNVPSERTDGESFTWRDSARGYLNWRHALMQKMGTESIHGTHASQTTLGVDS